MQCSCRALQAILLPPQPLSAGSVEATSEHAVLLLPQLRLPSLSHGVIELAKKVDVCPSWRVRLNRWEGTGRTSFGHLRYRLVPNVELSS